MLKKTHKAEHSYVGVRSTAEMVGRSDVVSVIRQIIRAESQLCVIHIVGEGGIGKTFLIKHVLRTLPADVPLRTVTQPIDLYHAANHTRWGLINAIYAALSPTQAEFRTYRQARETMQYQGDDQGVAQIINAFISDLCRVTQKKRLVLVFDTLEKLFVQPNPVDQRLGLDQEHRNVLNWLLRDFFTRLHNTVVIVAGRPTPNELPFPNTEAIQLKQLELKGLTESETLQYFDAIAAQTSTDSGDLHAIEAIRSWTRTEQQVLFHSLHDSNQPPHIQPILLSLAIDHFVISGWPLPILDMSVEEAKALSAADRQACGHSIAQALVQSLRNNHRGADDVVIALGWLQRGADIDLLSKITGHSCTEIRDTLNDIIKDLSFVKVHPTDQRIYLHDKMYDFLWMYGLEKVPEPRRSRIYKIIITYYQQRIDTLRSEIQHHYQPESAPGYAHINQLIDAKSRELQEAIVDAIYYYLRWRPAQGFQTYFCYVRDAAVLNPDSLALQLQNELLAFLQERDPHQARDVVDGLARADVQADRAIGWIKWLADQEQFDSALEVAQQLRDSARDLIEPGGQIALAELDVWEGFLQSYHGDFHLAESRVKRAIAMLEALPPPHSVRSAGVLAFAYNNLGYIYSQQREPHQAIETYKKALTVWRWIGKGVETELANTLNNLAFDKAEIGQFEEAYFAANEALQLRERAGPQMPVGLSLNTLAHIRLRHNDLDGARKAANQARLLFKSLNVVRGEGLACIALAETERRLMLAKDETRLTSVVGLETAIRYAQTAVQIFKERVHEQGRCIEALIELGCAYREWARLLRENPTLLGARETLETAFTRRQLITKAEAALLDAVSLARQHTLLHHEVDALLDLAWLRYYVSFMHRDYSRYPVIYQDFYSRNIAPIEDVVGRFAFTDFSQSLKDRHRTGARSVYLGYLEILKAHLAFEGFTWSDRRDITQLSHAMKHCTLAMAYYRLYSPHIFRNMRPSMTTILGYLDKLTPAHMVVVFNTITETEQSYRLPGHLQAMRRLVEQYFGPTAHFVAFKLANDTFD